MNKEIKSLVALFKQLVEVAPFVNVPLGHHRIGDWNTSAIETYRAEDNVFAVKFGNFMTGRIDFMCYDTTQFELKTFVKDMYINMKPSDLKAIEKEVKNQMMIFLSSCTKGETI